MIHYIYYSVYKYYINFKYILDTVYILHIMYSIYSIYHTTAFHDSFPGYLSRRFDFERISKSVLRLLITTSAVQHQYAYNVAVRRLRYGEERRYYVLVHSIAEGELDPNGKLF